MDDAQGERTMLLIAASKYDAAMSIIAASLANDPEDSDAWALRSQVHLARDEKPQALAAVNRAIAAAPDDAVGYGAKALMLLDLGEVSHALDAARLGVGLAPDDAWLQGSYALAMGMGALQGLPGCTRDDVWRAVWRVQELDDMSNPTVAVYAAMALLMVGPRVKAVEILERAMARHPDSAELMALLGMCRNPHFNHADAWELMGSANALNSKAVGVTRLPIVARAFQMAKQYLTIGGQLLGLACVWLYLETYAGWSASARLITGAIVAAVLLPTVVSHVRMPAHTRGFLRDNVRHQGLLLWGGVLAVVAGLVAVFGPRPLAVPSIVVGFVAASAGIWAAGKVQDSVTQSAPANIFAVASFKGQQNHLVGWCLVVVIIVLLHVLDLDTVRVVMGALLFAPLPVVGLQWIVSPRSAAGVSYPGRSLMLAASYLGLAALPVMAWAQGPPWTLISAGALLTVIVLWGAARRRNAAAGSSWRAAPGSRT